MTYTLTQVRPLLNQTELALFDLSRVANNRSLSAAQIDAKIKRARALRDKYRDTYRRQTVAVRQDPTRSRRFRGDENDRTQRKGDVFAEVLQRYEDRLAKLNAKGQSRADGGPRAPVPGNVAARSSGPSPAVRRREEPHPVDATTSARQPMRGATTKSKRDTQRADRAAQRKAQVEPQAGAAPPGDSAPDKASRKAPAKPAKQREVNLLEAVSDALEQKQAALQRAPDRARDSAPADRVDKRFGEISSATRGTLEHVTSTRTPARAERENVLKAEPVNKKIHASTRSRTQKFQAKRDAR